MMDEIFTSSKVISTGITDLEPILQDVKEHFGKKGFEVAIEPNVSGAIIKINKGVSPGKLSLTTEIKLYSGSASVSAEMGGEAVGNAIGAGLGVGLSTALLGLSGFVGLGFLGYEGITLAKQAKLDNEMVEVVEDSIIKHDSNFNSGRELSQSTVFCRDCGRQIPADAKFCPNCGKTQ